MGVSQDLRPGFLLESPAVVLPGLGAVCPAVEPQAAWLLLEAARGVDVVIWRSASRRRPAFRMAQTWESEKVFGSE